MVPQCRESLLTPECWCCEDPHPRPLVLLQSYSTQAHLLAEGPSQAEFVLIGYNPQISYSLLYLGPGRHLNTQIQK